MNRNSLQRHPGGKMIDLCLYYLPQGDAEWTSKRTPPYPAPFNRPVRIEREGQLMFLFVNDIYIDVFLAPARREDGVKLTRTQKLLIGHALAS